MTMLSFRASADVAAELRRWTRRLGVDRSALLREALHQHLVRLRAEDEIEAWSRFPPTPDEEALAAVADWGPAEDWSDWVDATR